MPDASRPASFSLEDAVLDIGGDIGALILYTDAEYDEREIGWPGGRGRRRAYAGGGCCARTRARARARAARPHGHSRTALGRAGHLRRDLPRAQGRHLPDLDGRPAPAQSSHDRRGRGFRGRLAPKPPLTTVGRRRSPGRRPRRTSRWLAWPPGFRRVGRPLPPGLHGRLAAALRRAEVRELAELDGGARAHPSTIGGAVRGERGIDQRDRHAGDGPELDGDDVVEDTPAVRVAGQVAAEDAQGARLGGVGGMARLRRSRSAMTGPV